MSILQFCSSCKGAGKWLLTTGLSVAVGMACPVVTIAFENSVVIESKTVVAGARDVRVAIFLSNDEPITSIGLPLEIRSVSGDAFTLSSIALTVNPAGRLHLSPLTEPWAQNNPKIRTNRIPSTTNDCSGPISGSYDWGLDSASFISPDGQFFGAASPFGWLVPGSDPQTPESSSLAFVFDVRDAVGSFEIDTCCFRPSAHLHFLDTASAEIIPNFSTGVVTVAACDCPCHGDPVCNGGIDVLDVIAVIDRAFRGGGPTGDPTCDTPVLIFDGRTDVDCSGLTDIADVTKVIEVAFRSGSRESEYCDPCNNSE